MLVRVLYSIVMAAATAAAATTTTTASSVRELDSSNNAGPPAVPRRRRRNLVAKKTQRPTPTPPPSNTTPPPTPAPTPAPPTQPPSNITPPPTPAPTFPTGFAPSPAAPYPDLGYYKIKIKNDTPFPTVEERSITYVLFSAGCNAEHPAQITSGSTWTGESRGGCLLEKIYTTLIRPEDEGGNLKCSRYTTVTGTGYSEFYIVMYDGRCCVRSFAESMECPVIYAD